MNSLPGNNRFLGSWSVHRGSHFKGAVFCYGSKIDFPLGGGDEEIEGVKTTPLEPRAAELALKLPQPWAGDGHGRLHLPRYVAFFSFPPGPKPDTFPPSPVLFNLFI